MTRFLTFDEALEVGEAAFGKPIEVRDVGLFQSALHRPMQSLFGMDAYGSVWEKAAALMHSFSRNHALVDGNKRTGLALTLTFLALNDAYDGGPRDPDVGEALVLDVAEGKAEDVAEIAERLEGWLA